MKPRVKYYITLSCTIALAIYAVAACAWSDSQARRQLCQGLQDGGVRVDDAAHTGFVQADSLTRELTPMLGDLTTKTVQQVNLASIRDYITGLDKIESAEVTMLNNNRLRITVTPLIPVARIWPANGRSYYVNREGKRIQASARYHLDVPQIYGNVASPAKLLALLDYLKAHPDMHRTVSMISATDSANVILMPAFRGPVVNVGDGSGIDSKLSRLQNFYRQVLPAKGWEYYDTISLKWDNQVVATRRKNKLPRLDIELIDELEHEGPDAGTIATSNEPDSTHTTNG